MGRANRDAANAGNIYAAGILATNDPDAPVQLDQLLGRVCQGCATRAQSNELGSSDVRLTGKGTVIGVLAAGFSAAVVLSGCGPTLTASAGTAGADSEATIVVTPAADTTNVDIANPVVVTAEQGRLTTVTVTGDAAALPGSLNADGTVWTSDPAAPMTFGTTYRVVAAAVDSEGRPTEVSNGFTTLTPQNILAPDVRYMDDGATVGVGMPLVVSFNEPVTNRKAVEEQLKVTTSVPVLGAWSWNDSGTRVSFRPKDPWPANIQVVLNADLYGVKANDTTYGDSDFTFTFNTGNSLIMNVDAATHTMVVMQNDQPIATYPITTGKPGFETREGVKVISGKEGTVIMDAATTGIPRSSSEYYRLEVDYSMRLTDSGEFIHAAPWSVGSQGNANVSHGCIGMSNANAATLYGMARPGDIVIVTNTGRPTTLGNGITVWNETWDQWLAASTVGAQTTGPIA